jgi:hypothetical protein
VDLIAEQFAFARLLKAAVFSLNAHILMGNHAERIECTPLTERARHLKDSSLIPVYASSGQRCDAMHLAVDVIHASDDEIVDFEVMNKSTSFVPRNEWHWAPCGMPPV